MGLISDIVGPEGSNLEDARLQALLDHRQKLEEAPEYEQPSTMKQLLPLILSQVMDLLSTERALNTGAREGNPIPGMGSTSGRIGINALQAYIIGQFLNKNRAFGNLLNTGATGMHSAATLNNLRTSGDLR